MKKKRIAYYIDLMKTIYYYYLKQNLISKIIHPF